MQECEVLVFYLDTIFHKLSNMLEKSAVSAVVYSIETFFKAVHSEIDPDEVLSKFELTSNNSIRSTSCGRFKVD